MAADLDRRLLRRALKLAARGRFTTSPNPMVGAVLARDGEIVGEGFHRRAGGPHAEPEALAQAGTRARGATLYVTLEPCSHHGRTPPCAEAVVAAGVRRVVVCHRDPDPRVAGRGFQLLREAGIEVEIGRLAAEAVGLNLRYLIPALVGRPAIILKWAMSLDGKIATTAGESRWISSPGARRWSLELREENDAILVGSGTALADDPRLTRRRKRGGCREPILRVVLDRRLRLSPKARLFAEEGPVLIYTRSTDSSRYQALREAGGEVILWPGGEPREVVDDLFARGVKSLLVEGGGEIHQAFVAAGLYDRVVIDCAPLLVGGREAPGPLAGEGFRALAEAPRLEGLAASRRDGDLILTGAREGCLRELCSNVGV